MSAPVLAYEDLGLVQGTGWLFRHLNLYIGERDRLALIGRNGAGKTTLLKLIAGTIEPDEGKRTIVPGTNVVDVHVGRLRRKLEEAGSQAIQTARGEGYIFAPLPAPA